MENLTHQALLPNNKSPSLMQTPLSKGYNINSSNVVNIANEKMSITNQYNNTDETGKVDSSVSQGDMEQ